MSTRLVRLDDLTGEVLNDGAPVRFSLGDSEYEIDLTSENRRRLLDLLAPYIDAARRASYRTTALPKAGPKKRR